MKRKLSALILAAAVGGCASTHGGSTPGAASGTPTVRGSAEYVPMNVPGVVGPYGQPIPMAAPYTTTPPHNAAQARRMMADSVPLDYVQMMDPSLLQCAAQMPGQGGLMGPPGMPMSPPMMSPGGGMMPPGGGMMPPGGGMMPPNMPQSGGMGPSLPPGLGMNPFNIPRFVPSNSPNGGSAMGPNGAMIPPGNMMFTPNGPFPGGRPPGAVAALGAITGPGYMPGGPGYKIGRTQVRFARPSGMKVAWLTQGADGKATYSGTVIEAPGRYNFLQASYYRLKLSNIEGRPGLEIYPTLEVVPCNPKTEAFLAHSAVQVDFTNEDFQEVVDGKYVVKVIYLPDPQFQELAAAGTEEIISTRLEPGADPILEAQRRGSILLVIRMGNVDQEAPNTPPLDNPGANFPPQAMMPTMPPGMAGSMPPGMPGSMPPVGPTAPTGPGMTPGATGPTSPSMPAPGPSVPPYLRSGPGLPMPSDPHTPPATTPVTPPTGPAMPLPPGTSWRPANDSGTLPASLPPMPPSPAERAK
jgi:hypothetical protein